jgi:aspartate aminotransferase
MTISRKIAGYLEKGSWIRRMFEEGKELKARYGVDNVYDFSLGNPNLEPPPLFRQRLKEIVASDQPGTHGYMSNAGYLETRTVLAAYLAKENNLPFTANEVIMTCGAAGALNTALKALLDPGDEVIIISPYFVEYNFYVDNHGGVCRTVPSLPDFTLDPQAIDRAITDKTKAIVINTPNNPTGQIYPESNLRELAEVLRSHSKQTIYILSDEPYRKLVYDGTVVPSIFAIWPETIVATSYSKDLSLPGERIGYLAVHPSAKYKKDLVAALTLSHRILGFVNAPALMQRVIASLQGVTADINEYRRKRDLLCAGLSRAGYDFLTPKGAFYVFPHSPISDEVAFVLKLKEENILTVPGSGFGAPGYFRISFCVEDRTIEKALPGFTRAIQAVRK